jgi:hypothetical protein
MKNNSKRDEEELDDDDDDDEVIEIVNSAYEMIDEQNKILLDIQKKLPWVLRKMMVNPDDHVKCFLKRLGLVVKDVLKDGNCLFNSLLICTNTVNIDQSDLRNKLIENTKGNKNLMKDLLIIYKNDDEKVDEYFEKMNDKAWGTSTEIMSASNYFKKKIFVITKEKLCCVYESDTDFSIVDLNDIKSNNDNIYIHYHDNHFSPIVSDITSIE